MSFITRISPDSSLARLQIGRSSGVQGLILPQQRIYEKSATFPGYIRRAVRSNPEYKDGAVTANNLNEVRVMKDDATIRENIESELLSERTLDGRGILVKVENGVATLGGYVPHLADRLTAVRAATSVHGVRAVAD